MTNEQKLSKAIQNEIGKRSMRELALNSLRYTLISGILKTTQSEEIAIDARIIASIPDDAEISQTT